MVADSGTADPGRPAAAAGQAGLVDDLHCAPSGTWSGHWRPN